MADSLWMRLRKISWQDYECASGEVTQVPKMLQNLASRKGARAMKAGHDLWKTICAGGVTSVAVPSLPFLIEILSISEPEVQGEIVDLVQLFHQVPAEEEWQERLIHAVKRERRTIEWLTRSRDEITAAKARELLESL